MKEYFSYFVWHDNKMCYFQYFGKFIDKNSQGKKFIG